VLLAGLARHAVGIGGIALIHACRMQAQAAVDAHPGDLTAAQRRGEAMTLDELITYTLDALGARGSGYPLATAEPPAPWARAGCV
jgi:hypothetical protein